MMMIKQFNMFFIEENKKLSILLLLLLLLLSNNLLIIKTNCTSPDEAQLKFINDIRRDDKCESIYIARSYGYDIKEFKLTTKDGYILTIFRLIHPEDIERGSPRRGTKKPYILLHGLIGSSSSFLRNIDWRYRGPNKTFNGDKAVEWSLKTKNYESTVKCSAQKFKESYDGDKSATINNLSITQRLLNVWPEKDFCYINELDYDGDRLNFGREFKQAYRKYELNNDNKRLVSTSLAFTLSNFGYDVWLLNLRGNFYSNKHLQDDLKNKKFKFEQIIDKEINIQHHHYITKKLFNNNNNNNKQTSKSKSNNNNNIKNESFDYWNFNIDTIIENDLPTMIDFIRKQTHVTEPMGFVSYSYTALHTLGLLTKFPHYQDSLQPIVMVAPALLTSQDSHLTTKYFIKLITRTLVNRNGPFPMLGHSSSNDQIKKLICKVPIASRFCRLLETILQGRTKVVKDVKNLIFDDKKTNLLSNDVDCGQTSTAVLHQIVENLSDTRINVNFIPWTKTRLEVLKGNKKAEKIRRTVMLIHSESDDISTMKEVKKISESALKTMTLLDYVIKMDDFQHADFLFSKRNQYLVNAEIARMTTLFDYMMYSPGANVEVKSTPLNTQFIL